MAFVPSTFPRFLSPSPPPRSPLRPPRAVADLPRPPAQNPRLRPGQPGHRFHDYEPSDVEAVRLRHILVHTQEMAAEIFHQVVRGGVEIADVARTVSVCEVSKKDGGDLGWWWIGEKLPDEEEFGICEELLNAAKESRANHVGIVQGPKGWHVFVVEEVRHKVKVKMERTKWRIKTGRKNVKVAEVIKGTYALQTLGCQMNRSDSERMAGELERKGLRKTDDVEKASVVVLNTCNIRDHAEKKVYSYMGRHVERKRQFPTDVTLVVAGCVAQQEGERMLRRIPELDLVFGPQYANRLGHLLDEVERNGCQIAATDPVHVMEDISKPRRESDVTAWVNVMYGCGENCTFCTVGNVVRSVEQSRSMDMIRKEVEEIAKAGIREVVLLGQNIDAYGRDMWPKKHFWELLTYIHDVDGIERIRFTTSHPRYISEKLVKTCQQLPKVMPFFHIPPQAGSNKVLKEMRRGYTVQHFKHIVSRIRNHIPDAAICGDMIVGFPGETEEEFQESLELLHSVKFDAMNTAAYSPRPQTPAAEREDQIAEHVKSERLARMNRVVSEVAEERSQRFLGRIEEVLVEGINPRDATQMVGRNPANRPVYFKGSEELKGKLVPVRIVQAFPFSLRGEQAGEPY